MEVWVGPQTSAYIGLNVLVLTKELPEKGNLWLSLIEKEVQPKVKNDNRLETKPLCLRIVLKFSLDG